MRIFLRILLVLGIVLVVAVVGFVVWARSGPAPMAEAPAALESDAAVSVSGSNPIAFTPAGDAPTCGFIFYQGGRVDERAYAPALRAIAEEGVLVLTPSMPLNLAVFGIQRAAALIESHPEVEHWVIGGHSLGGSMAAAFADGSPAAVEGLALWASYPAQSNSLAEDALAVASIYATLDGLATPEIVRGAATLLPEGTSFVPIEGGNHAQFGWYGEQRGDNPATITRPDQQAQTVAATLALIDSVCE